LEKIKTAEQCRTSHSAHGHSAAGRSSPWLAQPWPAQPGSGGVLRTGDGLPAHGVGARGGTVTVASAPMAMWPSSAGRQARWGGADPESTSSAQLTRQARFHGRGLTNTVGWRRWGGLTVLSGEEGGWWLAVALVSFYGTDEGRRSLGMRQMKKNDARRGAH
jgi:hypothetical protein